MFLFHHFLLMFMQGPHRKSDQSRIANLTHPKLRQETASLKWIPQWTASLKLTKLPKLDCYSVVPYLECFSGPFFLYLTTWFGEEVTFTEEDVDLCRHPAEQTRKRHDKSCVPAVAFHAVDIIKVHVLVCHGSARLWVPPNFSAEIGDDAKWNGIRASPVQGVHPVSAGYTASASNQIHLEMKLATHEHAHAHSSCQAV